MTCGTGPGIALLTSAGTPRGHSSRPFMFQLVCADLVLGGGGVKDGSSREGEEEVKVGEGMEGVAS